MSVPTCGLADRVADARARADLDYLRHALAELETLAAQPGEEAALAERRALMQGADKVRQELGDAAEAVATPIASLSAALASVGATAVMVLPPRTVY